MTIYNHFRVGGGLNTGTLAIVRMKFEKMGNLRYSSRPFFEVDFVTRQPTRISPIEIGVFRVKTAVKYTNTFFFF